MTGTLIFFISLEVNYLMVTQESMVILGNSAPAENYSEAWLTEQQVALMIGMSLSTLQQNRHKRRGIKYTKIGRSVRYAFSDVIEYMNCHKIDFDK